MALETIWMKLVTGNRLTSIMGLKMDEGVPYRFSKDYTYVEIPLAQLYNPSSEEVVDKALRNQKIRIIPACKLDLKGSTYKIFVKTNPKLQEYANCPALLMLDTQEGEQASFYATFQKDMDRKELDWAVRLYLTT